MSTQLNPPYLAFQITHNVMIHWFEINLCMVQSDCLVDAVHIRKKIHLDHSPVFGTNNHQIF